MQVPDSRPERAVFLWIASHTHLDGALPYINNKARREKSGNVKTEEVVYAVREVAADRSLDTSLACCRNKPLQSGRVQCGKE